MHHVTRGQFRQFVKDLVYNRRRKGGRFRLNRASKIVEPGKYYWQNAGFDQTDEHPVVNVSWNDSVAFCSWLSRKEREDLPIANGGRVGVRLPEEGRMGPKKAPCPARSLAKRFIFL